MLPSAARWADGGWRRWRCSGIGIRRLSITPAAVGPIKELVRKVDLAEIGEAMNGWLAAPPPNMRVALEQWAGERGIDFD